MLRMMNSCNTKSHVYAYSLLLLRSDQILGHLNFLLRMSAFNVRTGELLTYNECPQSVRGVEKVCPL